MKALTIRQPSAWAIAIGAKDVENRTWPTHYRGEFLIHAGKTPCSADVFEFCNWEAGLVVPDELTYGAIIGKASIVDCISNEEARRFSIWARWGAGGDEDMYAWILESAELFDKPIPVKGQQGFFEVEA